MARKPSPTLTDGELKLMDVLWDKGAATVADVVAALSKRRAAAYSTVLTMMRILEQKGYVRHEQRGRAFVYRPVVDRGKVRRNAIRYLMSRLFQNSPELLLVNVLANEKLTTEELERLKKMIGESE